MVKIINVVLSKYCNLSCKHCVTNSSPKAIPTQYEIERIRDLAIEALCANPSAKLTFTGGEPLIEPNYSIMLDILKADQINLLKTRPVRIITNGTSLTTLERCKETLFKVTGLSELVVSWDNFHTKEKPSSFISRLNFLRDWCIENHIELSVNYCLSSPLELPDDLISSLMNTKINLIKVAGAGRNKHGRHSYTLHAIHPGDKCPARDNIVITNKGYSFCCGNLNFGVFNKFQVNYSSLQSLENSPERKLFANSTMGELAHQLNSNSLPSKILATKYSTVCELCERISHEM